MEKLIILGNGISGCTAAVYAARSGLKPLVLTGPEVGGQLTLTTVVENFPGFPEGVGGTQLVENTKKQAELFGAVFRSGVVKSIEQVGGNFKLFVGDEILESETVIISTGASARWLGLDSEQNYKGRGVHTCATCDGFFYKEKDVVIVGGGDSAMEEALFLANICKSVKVIHRRDELRASKIMQKKFFDNSKTEIIWDSQVIEILGDGKKFSGVKIKNKNGVESEIVCDGLFLAIGHIPNTSFIKNLITLDEEGYVKTDGVNTNVSGIFVSGDVADKVYMQAITAAGTGCMASMSAERYLNEKV